MSKKILNYMDLKIEYQKLLEEKGDIIELKEIIKNLKERLKKKEKEVIELSYLISELMRKENKK